MHGAIVAGDVGGFSGEEEGVIDGRAQGFLAAFASDFHIAVCASRKRIGIPVVEIRGGEL